MRSDVSFLRPSNIYFRLGSVGQINSFRELEVYQLAQKHAKTLFHQSRKFPKEEQYALSDQIRRSSQAVTALLAEAWARRRYCSAFVNKVDQALGEAMETQAWLDHALACGYLSKEEYAELDDA